ncbi:MAG: tetratricopeptide repeat protein [Hahellaceae bacterium]|nr:tetratricopeptide repeat protein [Hahellaceae bacterium]
MSIKGMVRGFGVEHIDTANNGDDAINKCNSESYDIVLCDFNMGDGKNGQQVLEDLRQSKRLKTSSIFILITAETSKDIVMGAREYQPDCYIAKPITKASLQKRLDGLIAQREDLLPITNEIDLENLPKAISLCLLELKKGGRYQGWCFKTLAGLYYDTGDYVHAQKIYEDILGRREICWARIGLGKVQLGQQNYDAAIATLQKVIEENPEQMEAYDYLATALEKKGRKKEAQSTLQKAVNLSPRTIPRQQHLGELAQINQDIEAAAQAWRATVKFGTNSVYEKPDNYLNLSRCLSDLSEGDLTEKGKSYAKEALQTLGKATKRFEDNKEIQLNALMIETRVHAGQKNEAASKKSMARVESLVKQNELGIEAGLEMAHTLYAMNESERAEKLLHSLADKYGSDQGVMNRIEELLDEPVNLQNKIKARELNRKGISLFEQGKLGDAVTTFKEALEVTPRHPALNLNLVQVLMKAMDTQGMNFEWLRMAKTCLDNVAHIPPQHRQFKRYQHLVSKLSQIKS